MPRAFALLIACALLEPAATAQPIAAPVEGLRALAETPRLTLTVSESATTRPDRATLTIGVITTQDTAAGALAENSQRMEQVLAAIRAAGIPAAKVRTSGFNVHAQYDWEKVEGRQQQLFRGYRVSNSVRVETTDMKVIPQLLDAAITSGANNVSGPNFSTSRASELRRQARLEALRRADSEADFYAKARGFARARLISISDGSRADDSVVLMGSSISAFAPPPPPPPIAPGEVSAGATVTVQYILEK